MVLPFPRCMWWSFKWSFHIAYMTYMKTPSILSFNLKLFLNIPASFIKWWNLSFSSATIWGYISFPSSLLPFRHGRVGNQFATNIVPNIVSEGIIWGAIWLWMNTSVKVLFFERNYDALRAQNRTSNYINSCFSMRNRPVVQQPLARNELAQRKRRRSNHHIL